MKTKLVLVIALLSLSLTGFTTSNVDSITGVYDGFDEYSYNFVITDEDDNDTIMSFQNVSDSVLKAFDLSSDDLVGKTFEITYEVATETYEDEEGNEEEAEVYNIVALKAVK
ncbi:hypothetical protein [Lacinutrix salivirga]